MPPLTTALAGQVHMMGGMMVFEGFTDRSRRVLALAQEEAGLLGHNFIGTEHLLLGVIREGEAVGARAIEAHGVHLETVRQKVTEIVGRAGSSSTAIRPVVFTPRAKEALDLTQLEASRLGHDFIDPDHLLLGVLREGEGVASQALVSLGVDLTQLRQEVAGATPLP